MYLSLSAHILLLLGWALLSKDTVQFQCLVKSPDGSPITDIICGAQHFFYRTANAWYASGNKDSILSVVRAGIAHFAGFVVEIYAYDDSVQANGWFSKPPFLSTLVHFFFVQTQNRLFFLQNTQP
jgi:hypothetical protein